MVFYSNCNFNKFCDAQSFGTCGMLQIVYMCFVIPLTLVDAAGMFSRCSCVHLWTWYFINCLQEFHQIYNFGALGDKCEQIVFEVKVTTKPNMVKRRRRYTYRQLPVEFCLVSVTFQLLLGALCEWLDVGSEKHELQQLSVNHLGCW